MVHPVTTSDNECYNEEQRMTKGNNKLQRVVQRMKADDNKWQRMTANDNEWQRMAASDKTNGNGTVYFKQLMTAIHCKNRYITSRDVMAVIRVVKKGLPLCSSKK